MIVSKDYSQTDHLQTEIIGLTDSQKRRLRRKKLEAARAPKPDKNIEIIYIDFVKKKDIKNIKKQSEIGDVLKEHGLIEEIDLKEIMADPSKSRDEVLAARQGKKQAKQKVKPKDDEVKEQVKPVKDAKGSPVKPKPPMETKTDIKSPQAKAKEIKEEPPKKLETKHIAADCPTKSKQTIPKVISELSKSKDEVDRAVKIETVIESDKTQITTLSEGDKSKEQIKAERAAKKAAKQAKKKGTAEDVQSEAVATDMTVKDVVETLNNIMNVAKEVQDVTARVKAIDFEAKKPEEAAKSKAELKAERRAKQEAQRAAKVQQKPAAKPKVDLVKADRDTGKSKEEKPKQKAVEKVKKPQSAHRVNWFQHLYTEQDTESLNNIPINSNLHPAIIKLGVQLSSRVVTGSNARCIALLDALKKMVRDYSLPARTEVGRGLEAALAWSARWLWARRPPSASQVNALNYFRRLLTQLPNNIDEFDAKKLLQEEIDTYIREQIDKAGEAISIAVRNKISNGDNILTYGGSSLIERILTEAWSAGVQFRTVVVGDRVGGAARDLLRRLTARGLPCTYVDLTAIYFVMKSVSKVIVGASALLVNGSVLAAAGTAAVALCARAHNVAVLVACETHKFSDRVQTDAIVYNEIGDPDELIDRSDDNSPLKEWRSNPNLTPLNLTYDVTPPSLVTAVVTELAILPCTSAPVVLRFKLAEYGI